LRSHTFCGRRFHFSQALIRESPSSAYYITIRRESLP
jgi:hypothetical protein